MPVLIFIYILYCFNSTLFLLNICLTKTVSALKNEHLKLYSKFGGLSIEKTFDIYGNLPNPSVVTVWDALKISNFCKRAFLEKLKVS
jgi:hypothetical protein